MVGVHFAWIAERLGLRKQQQQRDTAAEVEALQRRLVAEGHAAWAARLDDVIAGGATGTEIVMGIGWVLSTLLQDPAVELSPETRRIAVDLTRYVHKVVR